jgi:hypothetical protein
VHLIKKSESEFTPSLDCEISIKLKNLKYGYSLETNLLFYWNDQDLRVIKRKLQKIMINEVKNISNLRPRIFYQIDNINL